MEENEETERQQGEYIYVYGMINNHCVELGDIALEDISGLKGKPVAKFDFKDISALTSVYPVLQPLLQEDEIMKHADILKKIAEKTAVLPMSFGMVFKDKEILEAILSKSYQTIKKTLELIEGKVELSVKVIKNQAGEAQDGVSQEILRTLCGISVNALKGDNFSERLLLNHSFLVERSRLSEFSDAIAALESRHKGLRFIYTGPWPPYSFVSIKIVS